MITWDDPDKRYYQHGLDRGVLYTRVVDPVPWNGLISVDEGGESSTELLYRDGIVYLADAEPGDFVASVTSIMFPDEFGRCIGIPQVTDGLFVDSQKPLPFDLSYRTLVGSGTQGDMFGYQIHLIYNCMATVKPRSRNTIGDSPSPVNFQFDIVCTPVKLAGYRPTAHYVIDTRNMSQSTVTQIENILYGSGSTPGRMPTPTELYDLMNFGNNITVTFTADGTYTVTGSSANVYQLTNDSFQMKNINGVDNGDGTYVLSTGGTTTVTAV